MGNYVGYSPWTDAGNYGAGLGATLGKALIEQPQMRYQLALQQQEMAQRQQQQIAQQQYQQGQLGMSKADLDLHRQELVQNDQMHQIELQRLQKQTELEQKGTWKIGETKAGTPYRINTITGETVPLDGVFQQGVGTNQSTSLGGLGVVPTQNQGYENFLKGTGQVGQWNQSGMKTNAPAIYQLLTNVVSGLGQRLGQQGLGQTNNVPQMPAQNQLGMATNAPQKVLRFDPTSGTLQ